jgi:nitrogen regulatory protein PII
MATTNEMTILTDVALITCMIQKGMADAVVTAARIAGAQGASIHYGRGAGVRERLGLLSITVEAEKEVVQIMVSKQQQEEVFAAMFAAGKLDTPGMGIMFITPLERAAAYIPPAVRHKVNLMQKLAQQEVDHHAV